MNRNKLIFSIIWWVVVLFILFIIFTIKNAAEESQNSWATSSDFTIWTLNDDQTKFDEYLKTFRQKNENYKDAKINIVSFSNYEDYYNSLIWAFLNWNGPDLFVLNNNDSKLFDSQIAAVDPTIITPDDFRKNYDIIFSNDLIESAQTWSIAWEYVRWIPLWYEVLWMFYNFRDLRGKNLKTWWGVNDAIKEISDWNNPVIWIWNWSTVEYSQDIITQFFLQDWFKTLDELSLTNSRNSLWRYFLFWDSKLDNKYDWKFQEMKSLWKTNLDLFALWDIQMIIWYPRMLEEIDKKWFNKSFLRVETFPAFSENSWNLLANYNYFVSNKNSKDKVLWNELLKFFASEEWQKKYLEIFNYYLPSMLSLVSDRLEQTLRNDYVIKYKDFYNSSFDLVSFDKKNRVIYDKDIKNVLDNSSNSQESFEKFRKTLLCISAKMLKQENMSMSCSE